MSRIGLAFSCFFKLLFTGTLPKAAAKYLPPGSVPAPELPPAAAPAPSAVSDKPAKPARDTQVPARDGALAMLAMLQREGRLIDFVRQSLDGHSDGDIGAAARDVHRGCRHVVEQHFTLEPMMPGREDDKVTVPRGFDPATIRLIGEAKGEPPFTGTLRHHGWRVTDARLPLLSDGVDRTVLAPAEVEV